MCLTWQYVGWGRPWVGGCWRSIGTRGTVQSPALFSHVLVIIQQGRRVRSRGLTVEGCHHQTWSKGGRRSWRGHASPLLFRKRGRWWGHGLVPRRSLFVGERRSLAGLAGRRRSAGIISRCSAQVSLTLICVPTVRESSNVRWCDFIYCYVRLILFLQRCFLTHTLHVTATTTLDNYFEGPRYCCCRRSIIWGAVILLAHWVPPPPLKGHATANGCANRRCVYVYVFEYNSSNSRGIRILA